MKIDNTEFESLILNYLQSFKDSYLPNSYLNGSGVKYVEKIQKTLAGYNAHFGYQYECEDKYTPVGTYIYEEEIEIPIEELLVFIFNKEK